MYNPDVLPVFSMWRFTPLHSWNIIPSLKHSASQAIFFLWSLESNNGYILTDFLYRYMTTEIVGTYRLINFLHGCLNHLRMKPISDCNASLRDHVQLTLKPFSVNIITSKRCLSLEIEVFFATQHSLKFSLYTIDHLSIIWVS